MNKMEEKLIELGYEIFNDPYSKRINAFKTSKNNITIMIIIVENKIVDRSITLYDNYTIRSMKDISKLEIQYKKLKKDLEVLRDVED